MYKELRNLVVLTILSILLSFTNGSASDILHDSVLHDITQASILTTNDKYLPSFEVFVNYSRWHHRMMNLECDQLLKENFIVFDVPGQGWANRIRVLGSAYLMAVLSQRVFLVNWNYPSLLDDIVEPPFNWSADALLKKCPTLKEQLTGESIVSKGEYGPGGVVQEYWKNLKTKRIDKVYPKTVRVTGYVAFTRALAANPFYRNITRVMGEEPLESILNYLIRPSKELQTALDPYLAILNSTNAVGLQIRIGIVAAIKVDRLGTDTNKFHIPHSTWPAELGSDNKEDYWFHCAQEFLRTGKAAKVFLATDNPQVAKKAMTVFGENLIFLDGPIRHSGGIERNTSTKDSIRKAFMDWYLLGEVRILLRTFWSTFGYTSMQRTILRNNSLTEMVIPQQFNMECQLPTSRFPVEMNNF